MSLYSHNSNNKVKDISILFHGRRLYDNTLLSRPWSNNYLDLWNQKTLYGKVDRGYNTVQARGAGLSSVRDGVGRDNVVALDFVADAFSAMGIYLKELEVKRKIPSETFFHPLKAYTGWNSFNEVYGKRIAGFYRAFVNNFLSSGQRKREVTDFDEYLPIFISFINHITDQGLPISRGGLISSPGCSHATSGLMIEVGQEYNKSDDMIKYTNYYSRPQYAIYIDVAAKFGFYVDLHVPWRLVANLDSPAWKGQNPILDGIVSNYFEDGYSVDKVFDKYYDRTIINEFEDLKVLALQFYNSYARYNSTASYPKVCKDGNIRVERVSVGTLQMEQMMDKYDDLFWLKLHLHLRLKEMRVDITSDQLKSFKREIRQVYSTRGVPATLDYISSVLAFYLERQASAFSSERSKKTNALTIGKTPAIIL